MNKQEMEEQFTFGLRLSTAAQLMQGMLAAGGRRSDDMVESAVKFADKLIEACRPSSEPKLMIDRINDLLKNFESSCYSCTETGIFRIDPYPEDVHGVLLIRCMCDKCFNSSLGDI